MTVCNHHTSPHTDDNQLRCGHDLMIAVTCTRTDWCARLPLVTVRTVNLFETSLQPAWWPASPQQQSSPAHLSPKHSMITVLVDLCSLSEREVTKTVIMGSTTLFDGGRTGASSRWRQATSLDTV
jgi:hypothetical protein